MVGKSPFSTEREPDSAIKAQDIYIGWREAEDLIMGRGGFSTEIRGVYATALTGLLLDHDFEVVRPSLEIIERFGLEASEKEPDLIIRDRHDRQGVEALGVAGSLEALRSVLRDELFDVILRKKVEGRILDVEFPWASKMRLDEYRGAVIPTVRMHHFYKACGGGVSSAVDMAERLLKRNWPTEEVEELLRRTLMPYFPFEGSEIGIEHVKLGGRVISLGRAVIDAYDKSLIRYEREMRSRGVYDGLGTKKEAGDRAVTEARIGEHYTMTRYFSQGGRFKGAYINLNTLMEIYPSKIRYVDLEVDVCVLPGGDVEVVDEEMLERAASEGVITDKLFEIVRAKVDELVASAYRFI